MNSPSENHKLTDKLDHAFNSLKTLVNLTQEVAGYLAKPPLSAEEPQPDRAQKLVDLYDQKRYCARLYSGLRDQCDGGYQWRVQSGDVAWGGCSARIYRENVAPTKTPP